MEIIDNKYRYDNEPDRIDSQKSIHLSEKTIGRSEIVHMIGLGALALGVIIAGAALGAIIAVAVIIITKIALAAVPLILGGALVGAVLMIPVAALVIIVSNKYFVNEKQQSQNPSDLVDDDRISQKKEREKSGIVILSQEIHQTPIRVEEPLPEDNHAEEAHLIKVEAKPEPQPMTAEDKAAVKIQSLYRGFIQRKAHLPKSISFAEYKGIFSSKKMPRASDGKTRVYLSDKPYLVFKESGRREGIKRFHVNQEVRAVLRAQGSKHLIIPRANLLGEHLVEERLPINTNSYQNMELYVKEHELFDDPVRELTRLFNKIHISDLINNQNTPISQIVGDEVRYDNLPFYIIEENGAKTVKIGLIDLEHAMDAEKYYAKWHDQSAGWRTLARIFPYHVDVILDELKKEKVKLGTIDLDRIYTAAETGKKVIEVSYHVQHMGHVNWLEQKGIGVDSAKQLFEVDSERMNELTVLIEKELQKINAGENEAFQRRGYSDVPPRNLFGSDEMERVAPMISKQIIEDIKKQITKNQKGHGKIKTPSELAIYRFQQLSRDKACKGINKILSKNTVKGKNFDLYSEIPTITEQLLYVVMQELVKGGEIYSYEPGYFTGGYNKGWVRY